MEGMAAAESQIFCKPDGLASHSYPSRNFTGDGFASGRYSPRGYQWELEIMTRLAPDGCKDHVRNLPVFITETGYKVGPGGLDNQSAYENMKGVLDYYANDNQVVASTAFVFIACGEPFTPFAIAGCDGTQLNGVGQAIQELTKTKGEVNHIHKAQTTIECPKELVENMDCLLYTSGKRGLLAASIATCGERYRMVSHRHLASSFACGRTFTSKNDLCTWILHY